MTADEAVELIGTEVTLRRNGACHECVPIGVTTVPSMICVDKYGIPNVVALDGLVIEPVTADAQAV